MKQKRIFIPLITSMIMLAVIIFQSQQATAHYAIADDAWQAKVDGWVMETANPNTPGQQTEFLVHLTEQADVSGAALLPTKEEKGQYVYDQLTAVAARTQAPLIAALEADGVEYQSFWVTNMLWVRGDATIVQRIASRADVAHIYANPAVQLDEPEQLNIPAINNAINSITWGVNKVNAPDVWAMGYDGTGIVVGGQDTGYDWDHPALINQYRGWDGATANHDYNWHDSIHSGGGVCGPNSPEPCDDHSHGTHTMGTIVGDDGGSNQIGMAPGAKWISCRNMNVGDGSPVSYSECYQWFIAPTQVNGSNPNPAMAPHVINNSWSCPPSEGCTDPNVMLTIVNNVVAAGIVTVHSAGNSGSSCSSVSAPAAIYDASYTIGSTDSNDNIAGSSSRGPVTIDGSGRMKPDISAPGVSVYSSVPGGGYGTKSGTSMAGPHVAGAVALLLQRTPSLIGDSTAVENLLNANAVPRTTAQECGGVPGSEIPNNTYGWGRLDILTAVNNAPPDFNINATPSSQSICIPNNAAFDITLGALGNITDTVTLSASGHPTGSIASFSVNPDVPSYTSALTISNTAGVTAGGYQVDIVGTTGSLTYTSTVSLTLSPPTPISPTLTTPANNSVDISTSPTFTWTAVSNATTYAIEIATDAEFTQIVDSASGLTGISYETAVSLNRETQYYWRVQAENSCGTSENADVYSFTTLPFEWLYLPMIMK